MKISTNWLHEYVEHDLEPEALAEELTMAGLEVDGLERLGTSLEGVVVGHVLEVENHPNADRLVLCQVDIGDDQPLQIACGAPNVAEGQKVPVATVGTTLMLPDPETPEGRNAVTIEEVSLRGETSRGMICAEDELGLSDDHAGIMVLSEEAKVGRSFAEHLSDAGIASQDTVLDIEITPNRPDATSHLGVARDVAALTDQRLLRPDIEQPESGGETADQIAVDIHAPKACPRYAAMLVRDVAVGESPLWLKRRLEAIGLRPRNNVVDATNYILHECGQPLHAFDLNALQGSTIHVRQTDGEQSFTTLDGEERTLPPESLLICDAERPVALAGIMGGQNSEVTEASTNVLIESAYFDPSTIRRTAKALQLQTDSSYRFERGVDPDIQVWAAARAAQLIAELTGGDIVPGLVDEQMQPAEQRVVSVRPARVEKLLGMTIPTADIIDLLTAIGFEVAAEDPLDTLAEHALMGRGLELEADEMVLQCLVPTFRPDVTREVDVIEEIARLYGYDEVPLPARSSIPSRPPRPTPSSELRHRARQQLVGIGYREIYTNSLLRKERAEAFNTSDLIGDSSGTPVVETLNPISEEMAAMRPSLLPGLLEAMQFNQNRGQRIMRFMEWGHVYHRTDEDESTTIPGYDEHESLILGLSGPHAEANWDTTPRPVDFYDLKGTLELLLDVLHLGEVVRMEPASESLPLTAYHLRVQTGDEQLGIAARLSDDVADDFELDAEVFFAELNWERLAHYAAPRLTSRYQAVSRFPVVERDLALLIDESQPVGPLLDTIRRAGQPLLQRLTLFDLYEGEYVEEGKKSTAFNLRFSADRTLRDEEVTESINEILEALRDEHNAELRR